MCLVLWINRHGDFITRGGRVLSKGSPMKTNGTMRSADKPGLFNPPGARSP
jgi:hypothetical protein